MPNTTTARADVARWMLTPNKPQTIEGLLNAYEQAVRAEVLRQAAEAAPDFFQPGHTYADTEYGWKFRVDTITTHPETGERIALGWRYWTGWEPYAYGEDDWDIHQAVGHVDITEGGAR